MKLFDRIKNYEPVAKYLRERELKKDPVTADNLAEKLKEYGIKEANLVIDVVGGLVASGFSGIKEYYQMTTIINGKPRIICVKPRIFDIYNSRTRLEHTIEAAKGYEAILSETEKIKDRLERKGITVTVEKPPEESVDESISELVEKIESLKKIASEEYKIKLEGL